MIEVLRENNLYRVELDEDTSQSHLPHRSWGTYRIVDRRTAEVIFESPNRDKAFGVFEFVTQKSGILRDQR
jgi:hypothetical protein